jgi:hypothetical protein
MPTASISPRIARDDYPAFKALLPNDPDFPDTFDEWQSNSLREDAKRVKGGYRIKPVPVTAGELAEYCKQCGKPPSGAMLLAFAVIKAARG